MNKLILMLGTLFLLIACLVIGGEYRASEEDQAPPAETSSEPGPGGGDREEPADRPEESLFAAATDFGSPNEELQKYVASQAEIEETHIRLTADRIGEDYLSGKAESRMAFRYGTFSFRVNTMRGVGLFPAIWLLPANSGNAYPEVDIYELIGNDPDEFYGVLHYMEKEKKTRDFFTYKFPAGEIPDTYEIGFEWAPDRMAWRLNGEEIYAIQHDIPDMPMYMILNLAVGGTWPGAPDGKTEFPSVFEVELLEFEPQEIYAR